MAKKTVPQGTGLWKDAGVLSAFIGAICILLMVAGYVVHRLSGERAHREKWKDYNDCGWA